MSAKQAAGQVADKYFSPGSKEHEDLVADIDAELRKIESRRLRCPHCDCECEGCRGRCGSNLAGRHKKA